MNKQTPQFWLALVLTVGLLLLAMLSMFKGDQRSQDQLVGAIIGCALSSAGWLFRVNGNGNGNGYASGYAAAVPPPPPPEPEPPRILKFSARGDAVAEEKPS